MTTPKGWRDSHGGCHTKTRSQDHLAGARTMICAGGAMTTEGGTGPRELELQRRWGEREGKKHPALYLFPSGAGRL